MQRVERYRQYIIASAEASIGVQGADGAFPAGCNNKWGDYDTPVRATSHFICQLVFAYKCTGKEQFKKAAVNAGQFLLSREAVPAGHSFFCRVSRKKDRCNGLIGQAWAIEALLSLFGMTQDQRYLDYARERFLLHPFNDRYGLFCPVDIDGTILRPAMTLNHQLIFAAVGMGLLNAGVTELEPKLSCFFAMLPKNASITSDGLINHHVRYGSSGLGRMFFDIKRAFHRKSLRERSIGYQSFNMYGLSLAHWYLPNHGVWEDLGIKRLLDRVCRYSTADDYLRSVETNEFALQYRLTGQELVFFYKQFFPNVIQERVFDLIDLQFKNHWSEENSMLCSNTSDPKTLSSRLYEMTYILH